MNLSEAQNAAAMHGFATNPGVLEETRLRCALQALEFYSKAFEEARDTDLENDKADENVPQGWKDLLKALILLSKGAVGNYPTYCEHDVLAICADPSKFTKEEIAEIEGLGFFTDSDNESFKSSRFGSA